MWNMEFGAGQCERRLACLYTDESFAVPDGTMAGRNALISWS